MKIRKFANIWKIYLLFNLPTIHYGNRPKRAHQQTTHSAATRMRNSQWPRSNLHLANTFSEHLAEVFQPFSRDVSIPSSNDLAIMNLDNNIQPIANVNMKHVTDVIRSLNTKKSPEYDLITVECHREVYLGTLYPLHIVHIK